MRNFAEILKEEREKISLSQTDLGKKLNCSRYRVADLERGKITPTIEDIKFLCSFFGISSDYLLGISDVRTAETDIKAICEYTGLTERAVEMLHDPVIREGEDVISFGDLPEYTTTISGIIESGDLPYAMSVLAQCAEAAQNPNREDLDDIYNKTKNCRLAAFEAAEILTRFIMDYRDQKINEILG